MFVYRSRNYQGIGGGRREEEVGRGREKNYVEAGTEGSVFRSRNYASQSRSPHDTVMKSTGFKVWGSVLGGRGRHHG